VYKPFLTTGRAYIVVRVSSSVLIALKAEKSNGVCERSSGTYHDIVWFAIKIEYLTITLYIARHDVRPPNNTHVPI